MKVKTLFAFLEQLIRAKESSQPPSLQSKSPAQENSWNHGAHSKSNPSRKYSTSALCTTTQGRTCISCGKNHWVWSCISFLFPLSFVGPMVAEKLSDVSLIPAPNVLCPTECC